MTRTIPLLTLLLGAAAPMELPAETLETGETVYRQTCAACHGEGINGAPRFDDRAAWAPLIEEGQPVLTAHAWVGVRAMPPRGGRADLSLEEFARAVAHMARAAGGDWRDPDAAMLDRIRDEEKKRIQSGNTAE